MGRKNSRSDHQRETVSCLVRGSGGFCLFGLLHEAQKEADFVIEVQSAPGPDQQASACLPTVCLPTIKQGRRMNRVDIQIVPDDEGYREVRNLFRNFV